MKTCAVVGPKGAQPALSAPAAELPMREFHMRLAGKAHVNGSAEGVAAGFSGDVGVVRLRAPPVVNLMDRDAFLLELLDQLHRFVRIRPSRLVGVNETVR